MQIKAKYLVWNGIAIVPYDGLKDGQVVILDAPTIKRITENGLRDGIKQFLVTRASNKPNRKKRKCS